MIELELTADERNILLETLENDIADLRVEIGDTDLYDYRQKLKSRKEVLEKVASTLQAYKHRDA